MRISDWSSDVCSSDLIAEDDRLVVDGADDALADRLVDSRWLNEREAPVFGRLDDRGRQWMFAAALEARGNPEEVLLLEAVRDFNGDDRGLAFGQRPGLVDAERVDLLHPFNRLGIIAQHTGFRHTHGKAQWKERGC